MHFTRIQVRHRTRKGKRASAIMINMMITAMITIMMIAVMMAMIKANDEDYVYRQNINQAIKNVHNEEN